MLLFMAAIIVPSFIFWNLCVIKQAKYLGEIFWNLAEIL